jgi:fermentation-respiration switch protein FrsA (DUF1100 family)
MTGCTHLFYRPDAHVYQAPEALGIPFETPSFPSLDGTRLTGLFLPAAKQPALGTVLHLHGNGGNMTGHWGYSAWLAKEGFNVLVLDYRGYGASEGKPSERGTVEDAVAALSYLRARKDVEPDKLLVLGQSLGGAIALAAVAQSSTGVRALSLDSAFSSYRAVTREKLAGWWLTNLLKWPLSLLVSDRERPLDALAKLKGLPLLITAAPLDPVVPYEESLKLYEAASQPKTLWVIPGEGHCDAYYRYGATYRPRLVEFFDAALGVRL